MSSAHSDFTTFLQQWDQTQQEQSSPKRGANEAGVGLNHFQCDYCLEECPGQEFHMPNPYHHLPFFEDECHNPECQFIFEYETSENEPYCPKCGEEFPRLEPQGSFCSDRCAKACAMYEVGGKAGDDVASLIDALAGMSVQEAAPWTILEVTKNDGTGVTRKDWDRSMDTETGPVIVDGSGYSKKTRQTPKK